MLVGKHLNRISAIDIACTLFSRINKYLMEEGFLLLQEIFHGY
jgi:hypothetical protein